MKRAIQIVFPALKGIVNIVPYLIILPAIFINPLLVNATIILLGVAETFFLLYLHDNVDKLKRGVINRYFILDFTVFLLIPLLFGIIQAVRQAYDYGCSNIFLVPSCDLPGAILYSIFIATPLLFLYVPVTAISILYLRWK